MSEFQIRRLDSDEGRPAFDCSNDDLNEFFHKDSIISCNQLLSVTYVVEHELKAIAFFSVANDALKKQIEGRSAYERITRLIPHCKRYSSLPAVKIGRFAVSTEYQSKGIGTEILDYLKYWFTHGNKTGCRFIVVDALNNDRTIKFYQSNRFAFLSNKDLNDKTRLMVFDLSTFRP